MILLWNVTLDNDVTLDIEINLKNLLGDMCVRSDKITNNWNIATCV